MRFLKVGMVGSLAFILVSTFWVIRQERAEDSSLPVYGTLEPFQLVNQDSTVFDSRSLKGSVGVVNFIFTSCAHVCPMLTQQMAKIQKKTKDFGDKVQLISISVDPERDTPSKLNSYGKLYSADFTRWTFLTGPIETIRRVVVKGFMNAMDAGKQSDEASPDLFEITHGENFVILDKQGNIRAFRQAKTDRDIQVVLKIIHQLSKEAGTGVKTASFRSP